MRAGTLSMRAITVPVFLWIVLSGCVQKAPPELLQAVQALDRQLVEIQGAEFAPEEYAQFVRDWVALQGRLLAEDDLIRWPWEANPLVAELEKIQAEGTRAVSIALQRKETERLEAEQRLALLEGRLRFFKSQLDEVGSRVMLGQRPVETELLARQARSFLEQGLYARSVLVAQQASRLLDHQMAVLTTELGRYADAGKVQAWRAMVRRTIEWSRIHQAPAIIVSKADRRLTLYRNGRPVVSYQVRLGYNGILEKRYQGDGATPEGSYRIIRKRDLGETQFHRALLLDYPNADDRRRFRQARLEQTIPAGAFIGGQIEIHGEGSNPAMSMTLGCVMLDNRQMDTLFRQVEVGTPVTIVGALNRTNSVALLLAGLERLQES